MIEISPCQYLLKKLLGTGSVGVEIGIWDGGNALVAIEYLRPKKYYMVDPYVEYGDNNFTQPLYEEMYQLAVARFASFNNVSLMRVSSFEASKIVEDNLDFVYVDGAHDYDNKFLDLDSWFTKLRSGGILCGDDFNIESTKAAVIDFRKKYGLSLWISQDSSPHPTEYFFIGGS